MIKLLLNTIWETFKAISCDFSSVALQKIFLYNMLNLGFLQIEDFLFVQATQNSKYDKWAPGFAGLGRLVLDVFVSWAKFTCMQYKDRGIYSSKGAFAIMTA